MFSHKQIFGDTKGLYSLLALFLFSIASVTAEAQYPFIIEMSHLMIGNATIKAQQEVVHKPGFWAKTGLDYHALIDPDFAGSGTSYDLPPGPGSQSVAPSDRNYIITTTPQMAGYQSANSYDCSQVNIDITYFDGLGRQLQDVSVMASPGQKDMITPHTYDNAGRKNMEYLSYEHPEQKTGKFDSLYVTNQKNFIGAEFGEINKDYGFTKYLFDNSPLNRIVKQSAPGFDWALKEDPSQEHVSEFEFSSNAVSVNSWTISGSSFEAITYGENQLFVQTSKNENKGLNRSITKEYKDKEGKIILIENKHGGDLYKTRYIYDDFGLLRCVVPPKATSPANTPAPADLCYYYRYDHRHRLVCKKLTGGDCWSTPWKVCPASPG